MYSTSTPTGKDNVADSNNWSDFLLGSGSWMIFGSGIGSDTGIVVGSGSMGFGLTSTGVEAVEAVGAVWTAVTGVPAPPLSHRW